MIAAVVQMNSVADRDKNLAQAGRLLERARQGGAVLAVLPEHFSFMQAEGKKPPHPEPLHGPTLGWLAQRARETGMWILGGSFVQSVPGQTKFFNTSPLLDNQGRLRAWYHKIHLFDLAMPGQAALKESAQALPGRGLVVADSPLGALGLSICYDLRFPELYRRLRLKGAKVLAAPSAFTKKTGQAHWELLVRTRAVENQCYLLAAAQSGPHGQGRESFGRAMIVDPWGEILAEKRSGPGVALAEIDPKRVQRVRRLLNSTAHARLLPAGWSKGAKQ